jgi:hypothetical protein
MRIAGGLRLSIKPLLRFGKRCAPIGAFMAGILSYVLRYPLQHGLPLQNETDLGLKLL